MSPLLRLPALLFCFAGPFADGLRRRAIATRYRAALTEAPVTVLPERDPGHVYHLFTVHSAERDRLQAALAADGIGTLVHYPVPVHRQSAFADLPAPHCPVADAVASTVVSLPLHPALTDAEVDQVAASVLTFQPAPERAPASR